MIIEIDNIHKSYRKNKVLDGINLDFNASRIIALLGPNGSGKTTLLKCILGMVIPDEGDILFEGSSVKKQFLYRSKISYLSQIARFPENLTVIDLLQLMKEIKTGTTREDFFIDIFSLKKEMKKKMGSLSGGTRQKVNIMLALMHDDPVIILDEPSTGLDPLSLKRLKDFILSEKRQGKLIIITTHILSLAEGLADDIIFILEGKIYFNGTLQKLLDQELANMKEESNLENAIAHILEISQNASYV